MEAALRVADSEWLGEVSVATEAWVAGALLYRPPRGART